MGIFEMAAKGPYYQWVAILTAGLVVIAFIVANLTSIAFPPVDGKAHRITRGVALACLAIAVISGLWFLWAARQELQIISIFLPNRGAK